MLGGGGRGVKGCKGVGRGGKRGEDREGEIMKKKAMLTL